MKREPILLRSVLFPRREISDKTALYFHGEGDGVQYCQEQQQMNIDGTAAFDTFFNSLAVGTLRRTCKLSALFLRLRVCGFFVLRVFGVRGEGQQWLEECLLQTELHTEVPEDVTTDLSEWLESTYDTLYFTLTAQGGVLYEGAFLAEAPRVNPTDIAVVICTYRREAFLLRNYRSLCRYLESQSVLREDNLHFYIIDNGRTLDPEALEHPFFTCLPNDNTGGSGGFTRGYQEAVNSGRAYSHILLMDDDIVLDGEMLLRVYSLLRLRSEAHPNLSVGGAMLRLSDGVTMHEAGAVWDGKRLHSIGNGQDMTLRENVFAAAVYPPGNYNAWWFYCFPTDWHRRFGYPLQFFVKEDDIEYSLRCADDIVVPCGISVWHDDFDGKYDGFQEYYIKRNELIMTSVSRQRPYPLFQVRKLILSVMKQTVYQRYFLADLIFRAYRDYLRGWKHFARTDTAALNRELMAACEPLIGEGELLEKYGIRFDEAAYQSAMKEPEHLKRQALSLNGYLLPCYPCPPGEIAVADLAKCRIVNFYRRKQVLHFDPVRRKGFVTRQKRRKLWWNLLRLTGMSLAFLIRYPFVRRGYRRHLPELTGGIAVREEKAESVTDTGAGAGRRIKK